MDKPNYGKYKVHWFANIFPLLEGEEFNSFVESIKTGLVHPIVLTADGKTIVDGRNRYLACAEAEIKPNFVTLGPDEDPVDYILKSNIKHRWLSAGQRAMAAVLYAGSEALVAEAKARQLASLKQGDKLPVTPKLGERDESEQEVNKKLAVMFGCSHNYIAKAKKVKEELPELVPKVLSGQMSLEDAYDELKTLTPDEKFTKPKKSGVVIKLATHDGRLISYNAPKGKAKFNGTNEHIDWAAWSWNPVTGCLHGCPYCYARDLATKPSYKKSYPIGFAPLFHHERLDAPANHEVPEEAKDDQRQGRVFVCSMADLYGKWVPNEWIEQVHESCINNPQWEYLMLTKFPRRYVGMKLPKTAWLGTSVDEQKRVRLAEEAFRQIKNVRVKWLSLEPLKADLKFTDLTMFDWIVIGSQTATRQPKPFGNVPEFAPPFEWVARLVDQAREAGCRVYLKPNLLGHTDPQAPGMEIPQEDPLEK